MTAQIGVVLTTLSTLALLLAARRESVMQIAWKSLASAGFVVVALDGGLPDTAFARLILAGLVLSLIGDVALLGSSEGSFVGGLVAFLGAHILYAAAFVALGASFPWTLAGLVVLGAAFFGISRWLLPHVSARLRVPVLVYMVAITLMVALAVGAVGSGATWRIVLGAALFYLSDLAVARHQFVEPGFVNRAWGLPVYYAAQLILASTV